jgi:hypothetical protein
MQHAWEGLEMDTKFVLQNLKERDHVEDLSLDGNI